MEGRQKNARNKELLFQTIIIKNVFNEQVECNEKDLLLCKWPSVDVAAQVLQS